VKYRRFSASTHRETLNEWFIQPMSEPIDPRDVLAVRSQAGDHEAFLPMVEQTEHDLRMVVSCYSTNLAMVGEVLEQVLSRQAVERLEQDDVRVPEQALVVLRHCLEPLAPEARLLMTERFVCGRQVPNNVS
jgi:hypothetical protein